MANFGLGLEGLFGVGGQPTRKSLFDFASLMPQMTRPAQQEAPVLGQELMAQDKKRALNEALMMAGAALMGSAGSGKIGTGLSQAMALGMDAYKKSLVEAQKLRDDQEQRLAARRQIQIAEDDKRKKDELFPLQKRQAEQEIKAGEDAAAKRAREAEDEDAVGKMVGLVDASNPVWSNPAVKGSGLYETFKTAASSGAKDVALKALEQASNIAYKDYADRQDTERAKAVAGIQASAMNSRFQAGQETKLEGIRIRELGARLKSVQEQIQKAKSGKGKVPELVTGPDGKMTLKDKASDIDVADEIAKRNGFGGLEELIQVQRQYNSALASVGLDTSEMTAEAESDKWSDDAFTNWAKSKPILVSTLNRLSSNPKLPALEGDIKAMWKAGKSANEIATFIQSRVK